MNQKLYKDIVCLMLQVTNIQDLCSVRKKNKTSPFLRITLLQLRILYNSKFIFRATSLGAYAIFVQGSTVI